MDFDWPADDDPRRLEIRDWLRRHDGDPTQEALAAAGYVAPHWPKPYGLAADPIHQLVIDEELSNAGVRRAAGGIGLGWAGPTILFGGTSEQQERYLWPILTGEEVWCQLFSEPDSGSDLANLATRAVRDGDRYIVNGSKIWSSGAHRSKFGILIARTDPDVPKHRGVSYFICPMDAPGLELRPIVDMTTAYSFNQTFFTDMELPVDNRIGEENDGWRLAKVTLGNERVSLSGEGALWGSGPSATDLLDVVRSAGGVKDPVLRDRAARLHIESEVLKLIRLRTLTSQLQGRQPGPEASVRKALADEHGQNVMRLAKDLMGTQGMLTNTGPLGQPAEFPRTQSAVEGWQSWHGGFLFSPALTIGGGTSEVQRNIVAERVLGLPHDIDVQSGNSWTQNKTG
ncbi:MAG: acyl-CoA dehydrogenase family protein [Actinomycetota bacterium]|jgi:alkylation response protein AidB-like acyl-CoA dehydrogenase|nr:acyl-CoA dehydrogenase family protein [Actinomycetota bacterium]